jgi:hypothetical protein
LLELLYGGQAMGNLPREFSASTAKLHRVLCLREKNRGKPWRVPAHLITEKQLCAKDSRKLSYIPSALLKNEYLATLR